MKMLPFPRLRPWQWWGIAGLISVGVLCNWISSELSNAFGRHPWSHILIGFLCVVAAMFILAWLIEYRRKVFGTDCIEVVQGSGGGHCLIMFVSTQTKPGYSGHTGALILEFTGKTKDEQNGRVKLTGNLRGDVEVMRETNPSWNWAPLLRGILPHLYPRRTLRLVYLIGSVKGSVQELRACKQLIETYLIPFDIPSENVVTHPEGVPFEDHNRLIDALNQALASAKERFRDLRERDIVIDITGGQKPTSIAGASVTLNRDVYIQYVQTLYPFDVIKYAVRKKEPVDMH